MAAMANKIPKFRPANSLLKTTFVVGGGVTFGSSISTSGNIATTVFTLSISTVLTFSKPGFSFAPSGKLARSRVTVYVPLFGTLISHLPLALVVALPSKPSPVTLITAPSTGLAAPCLMVP